MSFTEEIIEAEGSLKGAVRPQQPAQSGRGARGRLAIVLGVGLVLLGIVLNPWLLQLLLPAKAPSIGPRAQLFIFLCDAAAIVSGVLLMRVRPNLRLRDLGFVAAAFTIAFLLLEFGFRAFFTVKHSISRRYDFSTYVGWVTAENENWVRDVPGFGKVSFSTMTDGFRYYGDVNTTKPKVLVLGDSFTHAYTVSDGEAYFDVLREKRPDLELFVYGCGGYGSLQEYMALDKYIDVIKPDLILWQFGMNDTVNNSYELECESFLNNKRLTRPYLRNGRIEWLYPRQDWGLVYNVVQHSYVLKFFDKYFAIFKSEVTGTIESTLTPEHPLVKESLGVTDSIMAMVRERAGETPIAAFCVDRRNYDWQDWVGDGYEKISRKHSIFWIPGVADRIEEAKSAGERVTGEPYDPFHWNARGHAIAGELILEHLEQSGLLNPSG